MVLYLVYYGIQYNCSIFDQIIYPSNFPKKSSIIALSTLIFNIVICYSTFFYSINDNHILGVLFTWRRVEPAKKIVSSVKCQLSPNCAKVASSSKRCTTTYRAKPGTTCTASATITNISFVLSMQPQPDNCECGAPGCDCACADVPEHQPDSQ
jgi:hypothetical protein